MPPHDIAHQRLHNQHIAHQTFQTPGDMVAWLGAIQGQDYVGAKWSVGLRLPGSTEAEIEQAIADRHILRTWVMRGTLHMVAAADIRWMVALIAPRIRAGNARRYKELELDDKTLARSTDVIANALQDGPLTRKQVFDVLEANGISTAGQRGVYMLQRAALDNRICQGVMQGRDTTFMTQPDAKTMAQDEAAAELARRYFTSRGPATRKDFIWWSGLAAADATAGLEAVKSELAEVKINGQTYYTADSLAEKHGDSSLYLLPGFDEYLLGYEERSAVLDPQHARKVLPGGGMFANTVVWQRQVVGTWKRTFKKDRVVLTPMPFGTLPHAMGDALAAAADRYGHFLRIPVVVA